MPALFRITPLLGILLPVWLVAAEPTAPKSEPATAPVSAPPSVAEARFWEANKLFASGKPGNLPAARAALQAAADGEFTHAQLLLGNCLLTGSYGFKKSERKGAGLYRLAAERGNAYAKVSLGQCYLAGTGVGKDEKKASAWLNAALAPDADYSSPVPPPDYFTGNTVAGDLQRDPATEARASAHFFLGQILSGQKEFAAAHEHFLAAANAGPNGKYGVYHAAVQAAFDYAFGQGAPRDLAKANEMLDLSRRLGTRMNVAMIHNSVAQKTVDDFAVVDLEEEMKKSGEQMQTSLQLKIAASLADKKSKDYNPKEAAKWYQLAAESGQGWAMLELGCLYSGNELGTPDVAEAFRWFEKAGAGSKPKHFLATANLGLCYLRGLGVTADANQAARLFAKAKDYTFLGYLGSIGQAPTAPLRYADDKLLTEQWAREKNDAHAQYLIGLSHYFGWDDGQANPKEGAKWFKKAAKAEHGGALYMMGKITEQSSTANNLNFIERAKIRKESYTYFERGAAAGNLDARLSCASLLLSGLRMIEKNGSQVAGNKQQNQDAAEAIYVKVLELDPENVWAHNDLGVINERKLGEVIDTLDIQSKETLREKMLFHYQEAARLGNATAANNLALIYYNGKVTKQDWEKAYAFFEKAADSGQSSAHYSLGYMHENGEGVPKTYTEAAYHYRLAGLEGHSQAIQRLSNLYITGQGVTADLDRAAYWLNEAVRRGHLDALPALADVLIRKGENESAFSILQSFIKKHGNNYELRNTVGVACERLSRCYREGLGTKADPKQANHYFQYALGFRNGDALDRLAQLQINAGEFSKGVATMQQASQSSANALFHLGQLYYFGTHVAKDEIKALELIRKAAALNQPDALYFLAAMTQKKLPSAPTLDEAITLAEIAEACGHDKAAALREMLEQQQKTMADTPEEGASTRST